MKRIGTVIMALVVLSAMVGDVGAVTDGVTTSVKALAGVLNHITVLPTGTIVYPGIPQDFNAIGYEAGGQEQTITETWTLIEAVLSGTNIDTAGLLTIVKAEQQKSLTIRATDIKGMYGEATVTIGELKSINIDELGIVFTQGDAGVRRGEASDTETLTIYNDGNVDTGVSMNITPLVLDGLQPIPGSAISSDVVFPRNIVYGSNQPVGLTLTVPATAEVGVYAGTITFETVDLVV